ncbi:anthranilate synthase component I family protein [Thermogutta sp.]|uniref:anthranilate synthase component I family protein n=1 Tax=Thermogutta sp. TaxID=1962930 RepID=UPI0025EAA590|nr:anthranilate synthase component I family protein [Thermogutta sp.]
MTPFEFPLVTEIPWPHWDRLLAAFSRLPYVLFLDSPQGAADDCALGRYSFLMADPPEFFLLPSDATGEQAATAFHRLACYVRAFRQPVREDLPPFQGGLAGFWSYELNRAFEDVPPAQTDDCGWPLWAVGLYDVVLAADHWHHRAWLVSQGIPCGPGEDRKKRARSRLEYFQKLVADAEKLEEADVSSVGRSGEEISGRGHFFRAERHPFRREYAERPAETDQRLQKQVPVAVDDVRFALPLTSNFSAAEYWEAVRKAVDYIWAGDVFQVNLAQRLATPRPADPLTLYRHLRKVNAAPFAAYFDFGHAQLLSASPERFLRVMGGHVETRPIKGTRARTGIPATDDAIAAELLASAKDRAENIMITDLLRNDLSRVCLPESIQVTSLCGLERYAGVFHLVSVIEGDLTPQHDAFDLLAACFPGGSVTGAPKPRAMEIIAELEPHVRGPYCGSLGYIGLDGSADLNILIRTILCWRDWCIFSVGGGIVARSDPYAEYRETWHKARRLLQALELAACGKER